MNDGWVDDDVVNDVSYSAVFENLYLPSRIRTVSTYRRSAVSYQQAIDDERLR